MAEKLAYDPVAETPRLLKEIAPYNFHQMKLDVPAAAGFDLRAGVFFGMSGQPLSCDAK